MIFHGILAQAATEAPQAAGGSVVPVDLIWQQINNLNTVEALTFLSFGIVWLLYGWRVFKILVTISFGLLGLVAGLVINTHLVGGNPIWLGLICMGIATFFSIPLMRWGVSVLGALSGGVLTGLTWHAVGLPEQYVWAGALVGLIAGGMISFIVFKIAVMLFTCLGGSVLVVVAVLAILCKHMGMSDQAKALLFTHRWFLLAVLAVPMVIGIFLQSRFINRSKDWNI